MKRESSQARIDKGMRISERIQLIANKVGSANRLSELADINRRTLTSMLAGDSEPKASAILKMAEVANVSAKWLLSGAGPMLAYEPVTEYLAGDKPQIQSNFVVISRYNVKVSAGHGAFTDWAELLDHIPFTEEFFTKRLGRSPKGMVIVDASGDSMVPTIADKDLVMIDTQDRHLTAAIWAFSYGDGVFVKRLNVLPDAIEVVSDNRSDYRPYTIASDQMNRVSLIGRVVWVGRTL